MSTLGRLRSIWRGIGAAWSSGSLLGRKIAFLLESWMGMSERSHSLLATNGLFHTAIHHAIYMRSYVTKAKFDRQSWQVRLQLPKLHHKVYLCSLLTHEGLGMIGNHISTSFLGLREFPAVTSILQLLNLNAPSVIRLVLSNMTSTPSTVVVDWLPQAPSYPSANAGPDQACRIKVYCLLRGLPPTQHWITDPVYTIGSETVVLQ